MTFPRLFRLLATVAACVLAGAVLGGPARAASSAEYLGVNLQPLQQNSDIANERWGSFLQPLADGRMNIHRIQADWAIMEPRAPVNGVHTYQWNADGGGRRSMDWTITELAKRGLRAVPTLNNSPQWARERGTNLPDSSFANFAAFSVAYIKRYGPGGTFWAEHPELPQLPATQYELWNEANSGNFWTGKTDAPAYARFLAAVYPAIKSATSGVTLMPSIGWPDAANYLNALAQNGATPYMDAIAFHPYSPSARSMMVLVAGLRSTLTSIGRGDLPIFITESGQPANYQGTGKQHAYDGPVNDPTRAATQSLTAEALAHSDCGVSSFLVYAVTGTETNREILSEGFMGILRYADAAPNQTGLALQRASQRWVTDVANGSVARNGQLVVCGQGATPLPALLPLTLKGERGTSGGCVSGLVGFDGNPLEEADLVLETPDGRISRNGTNATGTTQSCVPDGPPINYVDVFAEVKNVARSPTIRCDIPVTTCAFVRSVAEGAGPPVCTVGLKALPPVRDRKGKKSSTVVRARLICDAFRSTQVKKLKVRLRGLTKAGKPRYRTRIVRRLVQPRFTLAYRPVKKGKETRLRYVTLQHGKEVRFTVRRKIAAGDQLSIIHKVNPKRDRLPAVRVTVTLPKPKAAPKKKATAKPKT